MEPGTCERHGLRYDPRDPRGCVLCRRERARALRAVALAVVVIGGVAVFILAGEEPEADAGSDRSATSRAAMPVMPAAISPTTAPSLPEATVEISAPVAPASPGRAVAASAGPAAVERAAVPPMDPADEIAKDFRERDKGHFTVRFEGHRETDLAYRALDLLDEAYEEVRGRLRVVPVERIEVVIYTGGKFRAGVAGPDWSLARYDGKIRVGQADLMSERGVLRDILCHEYAHALLGAGVGVPAWFHEGVAQYLEPSHTRVNTEVLARAKAAGELLSFADLSNGFLAIEDARAARLAYMQALAIVEFMAIDRGEDRLHGTIRQLVGGARFSAVYLETYGERLERRWLESLSE